MKGYLRQWAADAGFWSMVDQGTVSAGNFLTTILLARALLPVEYGIYAILFALMLMMYGFHSALVSYGLCLQGAAESEGDLRPLVGGSLVLTAGLALILGAATGAVAALFHRAFLAPWILLALLFWLLQETTRRALMARLRHREALWGDAVSYLGQAVCVGYLFARHGLTLRAAFVAMAATSAAAAVLQAAQLKLTLPDFCGALRLVPRFWSAGRWVLLANIAQAFVGQALLWFLALVGTGEVALFQSLVNVLRITNPAMFSVGNVILPAVAAAEGGTQGALALRASRRYGLQGALLLSPYYAAVFIAPGLVLRLFYGAGSAYAGLGFELRILILGYVFAYLGNVIGSYYYGLGKANIVFRCQLIGALATVITGLPLAVGTRVLGASIAYDLTFAAQALAFVWFLRKGTASTLAPYPARLDGARF
jgi:O-antigen/teichoic acid export membrane protein